MKKHIGSIVKKGNYYHWRYRDVNGRTKSKVVKNSSGGKVLDRAEAELIVEQWAKDLFALQQLKSKEQVIRHIAEVKSILQTCKEPIEKIEEAYFDHPSAPEVSVSHKKNYHSLVCMLINSGVNPLVVRDLVGHTTIDMTARYTHVALDTKINAVKSLPSFVPTERPLQTTTFAERISKLQSKDFVHLGTILDALLTEEQKKVLIQKLQ